MKQIRAGVIGVGYLGRFHAQKYAAMAGVELVGVVDVNPEQSAAVAAECSCSAFTDYRELLPLVDAVSVVVPTSYHYPVALDCIEAGVDMLLEKPMTTTLAEADELIERADDRSLVLQVGHLERFNPAVQAMEPFLTTPVFIESQRISTFKNRGVDVDVVLDLMIHDIDIILNIVKSPLDQIHTVGTPVVTPTTDIANARLVFVNGATANITVSRISRVNSRKMRIFQPGSYINVDFANRKVMTIQLGDQLLESGMPEQDIKISRFPESDALRAEIEHFMTSVRERSQPLVSGLAGRRALDVALRVMDQIREHQKHEVYQQVRAGLKR
ncbi:MAG: Gfo/Idh/MocA family oxidoreductase [Desulfobulbaceae bacterium]|uniref:Gfo/Idh/MocA family oxidoreductase n=1 Tax=Candidatus Desulfatifera sulfidica TaxID=2841691 RepID=A0A8J6T9H1_9BACT|nr:Gfo/Idh/MocA family oxidoreductase [Candidatus Desulfatifera sulfidica]